jgi:hypothetical protein
MMKHIAGDIIHPGIFIVLKKTDAMCVTSTIENNGRGAEGRMNEMGMRRITMYRQIDVPDYYSRKEDKACKQAYKNDLRQKGNRLKLCSRMLVAHRIPAAAKREIKVRVGDASPAILMGMIERSG